MTKSSIKVAGIDTGKFELVVAVPPAAGVFKFKNTPKGWGELAALLRREGVERVGIEASGPYHMGVMEHLRGEAFQVAELQPLQVKAYARFRLKRAKNDKIDAHLIAEATAALKGTPKSPDRRLVPLAEALTFIDQLDDEIARLKTRKERFADPRYGSFFKAEIKRLKRRVAAELRRLAKAVRAVADLAGRLELLTSIDGIGLRTALDLLIRMPELGSLTREEAASLAGLAPLDDDSATRRGQRHIAGGRKRPRNSLFMAAFAAAMHWNKELMAFYRRLRAKGKDHTPAVVACARKLLIFANTILARGTPWQKERGMPCLAA
jgi:transposase